MTDTAAVAPDAVVPNATVAPDEPEGPDATVAPDGTASDICRLVDKALADRPTAPDDAGRRYRLPESLAAAYGIDRTARSLGLALRRAGRQGGRSPGALVTRLMLASRGDALTPVPVPRTRSALPGRRRALGRADPCAAVPRRGQHLPPIPQRLGRNGSTRARRRTGSGRPTPPVSWRPVRVGSTWSFQVHALFDVPGAQSTLYIDCTHRQSMQAWPAWNPLAGEELDRWLSRERVAYHRAAHLFSFSEPTTRSLIEDYGVPAHKVSTTGAGINLDRLPEWGDTATTPTILFIGNDFVRKGGFRAAAGVSPGPPSDPGREAAAGRHRPAGPGPAGRGGARADP